VSSLCRKSELVFKKELPISQKKFNLETQVRSVENYYDLLLQNTNALEHPAERKARSCATSTDIHFIGEESHPN
jgi:hypothetical protein